MPVIFLALLLFTSAVSAQTSTSAVSGVVTDPTGSVVPGATVTLTNEDTGVTNRQMTTEAGLYSFPAVNVGAYTVSVEAKGFKTARRVKNTLVVNTPATVDIVLEVGETVEVVTVESSAEQLQTANATIGNVVTEKAIVELPLNGRNPLNLLVLEPGVVQRSAGALGTGIHVNGSRDMSSNVTIDGIDANEGSVPGATKNVYRINPDNIREYKVTTSNATAEEGRNSGASISVATRQGTNEIHGTVFEFFRNTALNANEFFSNALGNPKPDIKLNQYGFELGGPIRKNKTFAFFSWQGQRINFSQPVDQTFGEPPDLYTPSARAGIFRYWVADPNTPFTLDGQRITRNTPLLVDRNTGQLRPEVRTCGSPTDANCVATYNFASDDPRRIGIDPTVGRLLAGLPLPNSYQTGDGLNTAAYFWNTPTQVRGPSWMLRLDHTINENHSLFGRYLHGQQDTIGGDPNNGRPQLYPGFPPLGEVFRSSKNVAIGLRSVLSPRIINELTLGFGRFGFLFTKGEAHPDFLSLPAYARTNGTGATNGFNNVDPGILNNPRTYRAVTTPQVVENLTIISGAHIIKTGINFRFGRHNDQRGEPGPLNLTPVLTFNRNVRAPAGFANLPPVASGAVAGINSADNAILLGTINDVLGIPARLTQTFLADLENDVFLPFRTEDGVTLWSMGHRLRQYNAYIQDEWKLRPNLTLNLGLRWEYNAPPAEAHDRVYVPNKAIDGSEGPVTFVKAKHWYARSNANALGPRLAITWSPDRKTVFRTGYAMAFDTLSSFQVTAVSGSVPGLTYTCSATVGQQPTPGCASVPDSRIGEGFPNELPPPTVKPSTFLTPPDQLLTNAPRLTVFDQNLKVPTVHQWNFTIQRQFGEGIVAQIGYIGRRGTRLFRAYDINQISADPILPSFLAMQRNVAAGCRADGVNCPSGVTPSPVPIASVLLPTFFTNAQTTNDLRDNAAGNLAGRIEQTTLALKLRPNQQFGTITYIDSGGDSYYHSLQATVRKRFSSGLLFGAAYTWAKSIDNMSVDPVAASPGGGLSTTNARTPTDIRNWLLERGRSDFDRTHVFTANWIYDLPFGSGQRYLNGAPGFVNQILGGWSVNGLVTAMTGEPFSVSSGVRTATFTHDSRADIVGETPKVRLEEVPNVLGPVYFADDSAFRIPAPGSTGSGRNIFTAPGYFNMDMSVSKNFRINERITMQFRTEAFNVLNHANFDNPRDASVSSTNYRATTFGQTCCATVAPPSTQNIIDTGESARVIQLALRLRF